MAFHESSVRRHSSRSHSLLLSSATGTTSLIALLVIMLALPDINHVLARLEPSNYHINIGAFNIQKFGLEKTTKTEVMMEIARIVVQFDIIAIQEIMNNTNVSKLLLDYLKQCTCSEGRSCHYDYKISEPLGYNYVKKGNTIIDHDIEAVYSRHRERYAFFYRPDHVEIVKTYQYKGRPFTRPPFAVHVKLKNFNAIPEFLFIVVHVDWSNAAEEINSLLTVYDDFRSESGISNVIIGGDLNAGCSYWKEMNNTALTFDNGFRWLIDSQTRTNLGEKPCAYDRFITNKQFAKHIRCQRGYVYNYVVSGDKTPKKDISDHYPIGIHIEVGNQVIRSSPTCPHQSGYFLRPRPKRPLDET